MTASKTLQSHLSAKLLRDLAGPKVYARGSDYYEQNAMSSFAAASSCIVSVTCE